MLQGFVVTYFIMPLLANNTSTGINQSYLLFTNKTTKRLLSPQTKSKAKIKSG